VKKHRIRLFSYHGSGNTTNVNINAVQKNVFDAPKGIHRLIMQTAAGHYGSTCSDAFGLRRPFAARTGRCLDCADSD
jgi:hypothetical protein